MKPFWTIEHNSNFFAFIVTLFLLSTIEWIAVLLNQQIKRFSHERGKGAKEAVGGNIRESEAMVATKDYKMRLMWERKFSYIPFYRKRIREHYIYWHT